MCPHSTTHVSSYYYMCRLSDSLTNINVLSYYFMFPDTTTLGGHDMVTGRVGDISNLDT
jgi:hypothetical protein